MMYVLVSTYESNGETRYLVDYLVNENLVRRQVCAGLFAKLEIRSDERRRREEQA